MSALIFHVISWQALCAGLLVYGFAPGALLRLIVLLYPREHPRRRELIGELYAYPRIKRPFWVAEQLETALFEGLRGRLAARRAKLGPAGQRRGQGFQLDQGVRRAVEARAMEAAIEFYNSDSWTVHDVHSSESFDLLCRRGEQVKHVKVKGTTTDGAQVILTPNEVRHACENTHTTLFILSNIRVVQAVDGTVTVSGGVRRCHDPWDVDGGTLTPVGFRYYVPAQEVADGGRPCASS